MKEAQKEALHAKWYNFEDYKKDDYREVFNHEALHLDYIYKNSAHLNDIQFDEVIKELKLDTYDVLEKVVEDIEEVGLDYISMMGLGMSTKDWKIFINERKDEK